MFTRNEKGFTLIELMIVIAIIGILAAIAIPQFSAYRTRSYNAAAEADIRNLATAQEAYYTDKLTYNNIVSGPGGLAGANYGFSQSANVTLTSTVSAAGVNPPTYQITSTHAKGNKTYTITGPGGTITSN
jgi:type IV pilus assembly protein PilA